MTLEFINPNDLPAPPTYSHVVVATKGTLVFVAGQEPEDEHGNLVGPGDLAAQARQVPADTLVGVQALSHRDYLIEVEAIAVIDD